MWSSKSGKQICAGRKSEAVTFERMLFGNEGTFCATGNVLHINVSSGYPGIEYTKASQTLDLRSVHFIECKSYIIFRNTGRKQKFQDKRKNIDYDYSQPFPISTLKERLLFA